MSIFDKIGKTVSEAGQKTVAKTKELADTSKLNSMISEQEKIIDNQYFQIGKLYASICRDNCEDEFAGMIAAIVEAETKICDYKKQIQDIKGVLRCEKCDAEVRNGAAFCTVCGSAIPKVEAFDPTVYEKCTNCGAVVKEGMRFCTSCGMRLIADAPVSNVSEEEVVQINTSVCTGCGTEVRSGMKFCTYCGKSLVVVISALNVPEAEEVQPDEQPVVPVCTVCGAVIKSGMNFCTICGNKADSVDSEISVQVEEGKRFCTACGAKLERDALFCTECGIKL